MSPSGLQATPGSRDVNADTLLFEVLPSSSVSLQLVSVEKCIEVDVRNKNRNKKTHFTRFVLEAA